jgi:hypothetical protein
MKTATLLAVIGFGLNLLISISRLIYAIIYGGKDLFLGIVVPSTFTQSISLVYVSFLLIFFITLYKKQK